MEVYMLSLETERQIRREWERKAERLDQDRGVDIEIDEYSLELTANVLAVINPGRSSADHIRNMVMANMWDGTTSMGTAGWEATGYFPDPADRSRMKVRLSVSAYTVKRWLDTSK
jgi:hypothetical protein